MTLGKERGAFALVVPAPMAGLALHQPFHGVAECGREGLWVEDVGDMVEAVERLAQREGDARADLEDRETIVDQGRKSRGGLVIGRMRLEDEVRHLLQHRRELPGLLRPVRDHLGMAELDAGLHHDADGPREGVVEPDGREGGTMDLDGAQGRLGPRHLQVIERFGGASRHRHLGAHDIARTTPPAAAAAASATPARRAARWAVTSSGKAAASPRHPMLVSR